MRKTLIFFALFIALSTVNAQTPPIKNIIVMIPDGTSIDVLALARWMNNGQPLAIDPYIRGLVKTHCSDTPIGDSAPTGSTYATGHQSRTGFVATYPDSVMSGLSIVATDPNRAFSPLLTILEAAKLQGKSTGLVVTCHFPHATPADFSAHSQYRDNYELLSKQMVYNNIDVVFGGGSDYLLPQKRKDHLDLTKVLTENGITLLKTPSELNAFNGTRAWGLFAPQAMANDLDRDSNSEPSLAEMTTKAISMLSKNEQGFFMMVEGSKVDWSAHDNDPVGMVSEFLAFDKAVKVALDYAKTAGNTLVIVLPDHSNSGISIGNARSSGKYDKITLNELLTPLMRAKHTADDIANYIDSATTDQQIKAVFDRHYGIKDLKESELDSIHAYFRNKSLVKQGAMKKNSLNLPRLTASIITSRSYIGFTTTGHTGEDVFFAMYDPRNIAPTGLLQNYEVNEFMQKSFSQVNLDSLTAIYFTPSSQVFEGYVQTIDSSDVNNKKLIVKSQKVTLEIPENKNIVMVNGQVQKFPTLMAYNGRKFYVPLSLRKLLAE